MGVTQQEVQDELAKLAQDPLFGDDYDEQQYKEVVKKLSEQKTKAEKRSVKRGKTT